MEKPRDEGSDQVVSPGCGNCRYWVRSSEQRRRQRDSGSCRRFPPTPLNNKFAPNAWPETASMDWCGEWAGQKE